MSALTRMTSLCAFGRVHVERVIRVGDATHVVQRIDEGNNVEISPDDIEDARDLSRV